MEVTYRRGQGLELGAPGGRCGHRTHDELREANADEALDELTPPVAIAAYAAAAIAGSDPMKSGFEAFKLAIGGILVPFIFVYHPALLLQGSLGETLFAFALSCACIALVSIALTGWLRGPLGGIRRALLGVGAVGLVAPSWQLIAPSALLCALLVAPQLRPVAGRVLDPPRPAD